MIQRLTALRVMSDDFFQNSFFERKIVIFTLQFDKIILYVKPQPFKILIFSICGCYCFFSTSNHNSANTILSSDRVVIVFFSTSNHNFGQTTRCTPIGCYCFFSTSNHNKRFKEEQAEMGCYCFFSTSNHNHLH